MTHDEMIAVIAAQRDGQQVQWKSDESQGWHDYGEAWPGFNFNRFDYRVKPIQIARVVYLNVYPGNYVNGCFSREDADKIAGQARIACVRVELEYGRFDP